MPTSRSNSVARALASVRGHPEMELQRLDDLQSDRQHRIERGHRLLEDHRDFAAAHVAHLVFGQVEEIASLEQDAAFGTRPVRGKQPHDRMRGDRFSGAGFADQRDDLARADLKAEAFDRVHDAVSVAKLTCRSSTLQQRRCRGRRRVVGAQLHRGYRRRRRVRADAAVAGRRRAFPPIRCHSF